MTKGDIRKAQSYDVAMKNELIQKSRYSLSLIEQKLLLYMISKITPFDLPNAEYSISVSEFCQVCNFNNDGGVYRKVVREALYTLKTKPFFIPWGTDEEVLVNWFNDAILNKRTGEIRFSFSRYLAQYLYELNSLYTRFPLYNVLPMKSNYGIRLYELLKSRRTLGYKQVITIEELRSRLGCEDMYQLFADFRRKVIEPAITDINTYSDLEVKCEPVKQGRSVIAYTFIILEVRNPQEQAKRLSARNAELETE